METPIADATMFQRLGNNLYCEVERGGERRTVLLEELTFDELKAKWESDDSVVSFVSLWYALDKLRAHTEFLETEGYYRV